MANDNGSKSAPVKRVAAIISNHTQNPYQFGLGVASDGTPLSFAIPHGMKRMDTSQGLIPGKAEASEEELAALKANQTFSALVESQILSISRPV
jgi:hypothetical protein